MEKALEGEAVARMRRSMAASGVARRTARSCLRRTRWAWQGSGVRVV